jgi:hypothetical protein
VAETRIRKERERSGRIKIHAGTMSKQVQAACRYSTGCRQVKIPGRYKLQPSTRFKQVMGHAGTVACRYRL